MFALAALVALATLAALLSLFRFAAAGAVGAGVTSGYLGTATAIELANLGRPAGVGERPDIEAGSGPYLVAFGGLLAVVGGVVLLWAHRSGRGAESTVSAPTAS